MPGWRKSQSASPAPSTKAARHARQRKSRRALRARLKEGFGVEFHPHKEHVKAHAQLRADIEELQRLGREKPMLQGREKESEQPGRSQKNARDHFNHLRLAGRRRTARPRSKTAGRQNEKHLTQEKRDAKLRTGHVEWLDYPRGIVLLQVAFSQRQCLCFRRAWFEPCS